jgi:hypothetical protein
MFLFLCKLDSGITYQRINGAEYQLNNEKPPNGRKNTLARKTVIGIMIFFIVLVGASIIKVKVEANIERDHQSHDMMLYLTNRYNQEFEFVKGPYLKGDAPFDPWWEAYAITKGHPELTFKVAEDGPGGEYLDSYSFVRWEYDSKRDLEKKIKEIWGADSDFIITTDCGFGKNNDKYRNLPYLDAIKTSKGNDMGFGIALDFFVSDNDFNKEVEAERLFTLMSDIIIPYDIKCYNIAVIYYSDVQKEQVLKNEAEYISYQDKYHDQGKIVNYFKIYEPKTLKGQPEVIEIGTYKDLISYFMY